MSEWTDRLVARGTWGDVRYAVRGDGTAPAEEFYNQLSKPDQAKMNGLLQRLAEVGKIHNREKFKQIEAEIFEFKSFQIRISCYRSGMCWYLLHGFFKKASAWPAGELIRARNLLREHRGY